MLFASIVTAASHKSLSTSTLPLAGRGISQLMIHGGDDEFGARFAEQPAWRIRAVFREATPFESQTVRVCWSREAVPWKGVQTICFEEV
jgi:hypothetical protein